MSNDFTPSATPNGYDAAGQQTAAFLPEGVDVHASVAAGQTVQHQPVPAEGGGYKAAGGAIRQSMRDRIAARRPYSSQLVRVEAWEETVEVRSLPLGLRNDMMMRVMDPETKEPNVELLFPELIIRASHDPETGERIFADDDLALINGLDAGAADEVAKVAMGLSGMGEKQKDAEAGKSSETATSVSPS